MNIELKRILLFIVLTGIAVFVAGTLSECLNKGPVISILIGVAIGGPTGFAAVIIGRALWP